MGRQWIALVIIFVSFIQFTLNWFAIIPMFGGLLKDLALSPVQLGGIVSAFIAGYGIFHIPGGMLAERLGFRRTLLIGIAVESLGAILSAVSQDYTMMIVSRVLCGIGGSIYVGCTVGLVAAWFPSRHLAIANGLVTGVAFSLGAAIGLFGWGALAAVVGWRVALLIGAGMGGLTLLALIPGYPEPPVQVDAGGSGPRHGLASLRRVFGTAQLWIMSIAFLGGYGSYFSATALLPRYAEMSAGASPGEADALGAILLLSGIIGSLLGGWLADRVLGSLPTFLLGCLIEAAALLAVPFLSLAALPAAAALIGIGMLMAFVTWIGLPGMLPHRLRATDIPTAAGLMLTMAAIGGVVMPPLYALVNQRAGAGAAWGMEAAVSLGFALTALMGWREKAMFAVARVAGRQSALKAG